MLYLRLNVYWPTGNHSKKTNLSLDILNFFNNRRILLVVSVFEKNTTRIFLGNEKILEMQHGKDLTSPTMRANQIKALESIFIDQSIGIT